MSDVSEVIESYQRCLAVSGFFDRFYALLFEADPAISPMFAETDFDRQRVMIRKGITSLIMHGAGMGGAAGRVLDEVADSHGKEGLHLPSPLFGLWLDVMLKTVGLTDPRATPGLLDKWRRVLRPGVERIRRQASG